MLDINDRLVGRRHELAELRAAVESSELTGGACVLLHGVPGVGKSTLLRAFGDEVASSDAIFAYGRWRDGVPTPYSAIGEALNALARAMEATAPPERDRWRSSLTDTSASLAGVLAELVPALTESLGSPAPPPDVDAADARHRLHRAAIQLVSATVQYRSVVLAVDDLQWADQDSLLLLAELLVVAPRKVLVLGTYRSDEFDSAAAGFASEEVTELELTSMTLDNIADLLGAVAGTGDELAAVADEFHRRTGGNPLHIRQLLHRAQRAGALIPIDGGRRLGWDLRVLASIEVSATEAEFLGNHLRLLRPIDRSVLGTLAFIGAEFDLADAVAASGRPADVVTRALWSGMELHLIEALDARGRRIVNAISRDARYRFSHDRVAETARAGLSDDDRRSAHLRLGRRLSVLGEARLFEAARHVGIGGLSLPENDPERLTFVDVLRRAAARARAQASFPLALAHCRAGLELLGPDRWTAHLPIARDLHLGAADAALLVGDSPTLHALLDEAAPHLSEPADQLRLAYLRVKSLFAADRPQDAMNAGLDALAGVGEAIPTDAGKPRMANAVLRMRWSMSRWSNARLLALPLCEDPLVVEKQRMAVTLCHESYNVRPNLFPLLVRTQLELMLTHGHTRSSPRTLANYGLLLVILGDYSGAQRFGEAGMALAQRADFAEALPETTFIYHGFIRHWQHPVRSGLGALHDAFATALDQGNRESAGFLAATLLSQTFWVGTPLADIDRLARAVIPDIRSLPIPRKSCQAMQQMALNLMGRCDDVFLLAGESGYDEREVLPAAEKEGEEVILSLAAIMKQGLHFWSGDLAGAYAATAEAMTHDVGMVGTAISPLVHMIGALSMMQQAPHARDTARFVRKTLDLHRKAARGSPENYGAALFLVEGAWARVRGKNDAAERHLQHAIQLAEDNNLAMISSRAHEEAAAVYAATGRTTFRDHMLRSAYRQWLSHGVTVRTEWLAREHPWLSGRELVHPDTVGVDPVVAHQVLRALSAARTVDDVDRIILQSVADSTGADLALILAHTAAGLAPRASYRDGQIGAAGNGEPFDRELVARAARSTDSPARDAPDRALAAPIRLHDKLVGVIYARHERSGGRFTAGQREAVEFLCAQAAAPLSNLQLEAELRAADEYRQSLIDAQSRFVPNELLRILDIDDLRRVRSGHRVEREMTVLISDIRGYTTMLEDMDVAEAGNLAMGFLRAVELPIVGCNGLIQDVRGDEVLAIFDSADDAVRAGLAMQRSLREHNEERRAVGSQELHVGIGVNTGSVGVGLVGGVNRMVLTVIGDAVNLAARLESITKRYGSALLISDATLTRLARRQDFDIRRMERVMVVNRRTPVTIHEVYDEDPEDIRIAKRSAQERFDDAFAVFDAGDVEAACAAFRRCQELLPGDPVAPLHLAHCEAMTRGDMTPGQDVVLSQK
ncbi:AAA family ATPase [Mycolicibacterium sp. 018/SC-01/001]|uniref:AAA family ATPase n=1 Tax=Mycolicibacterium sp. 018/SC-01/001 TaxID=2592069 RepID=UPI00118141DE|nr:AAA family ATPase [Mycolicibacterium sp. 018/SC-01/001]TRW84960.1 AAA family ATPase [Mycolicibacterium sp. 018/SC-01/001]